MQSVAAINSSCKVRQLSRSWGPCMMLCEQAACVQVTWKADGTRYLMVLCEWGTYLIDRSFTVRRVQMRFPKSTEPAGPGQPRRPCAPCLPFPGPSSLPCSVDIGKVACSPCAMLRQPWAALSP